MSRQVDRRFIPLGVLAAVLLAALLYLFVYSPGTDGEQADGPGSTEPREDTGGSSPTGGVGDLEAPGEEEPQGDPEGGSDGGSRGGPDEGPDSSPGEPVDRGDSGPRPQTPDDSSGGSPQEPTGDSGLPPANPLGIEQEELRTGEHTGARLVAADFVRFAYGYTGEDVEEYLSGVGRATAQPEFFRQDDLHRSGGGRVVSETADRLERGEAVRSAARLEDFEFLTDPSSEPEEDGTYPARITFSVGEEFEADGSGNLAGDVSRYEQRIWLLPWDGGPYRVSAADAPEQSNAAAEEGGPDDGD